MTRLFKLFSVLSSLVLLMTISVAEARFLQTDPVGYEDQMNLYGYVHNDPVNNTDPTGKCSAGAGTIAGGAAVADGPLPVGEAIGAGVLVGSCITRGYRAVQGVRRAQEIAGIKDLINASENFNDDIFDLIDTKGRGKIDGEVDIKDIPDELLGEAQEIIEQSIGERERDQEGRPRGNPNGNRGEKRDHSRYQGHQERIRKEEKWLEEVIKRREDVTNLGG